MRTHTAIDSFACLIGDDMMIMMIMMMMRVFNNGFKRKKNTRKERGKSKATIKEKGEATHEARRTKSDRIALPSKVLSETEMRST